MIAKVSLAESAAYTRLLEARLRTLNPAEKFPVTADAVARGEAEAARDRTVPGGSAPLRTVLASEQRMRSLERQFEESEERVREKDKQVGSATGLGEPPSVRLCSSTDVQGERG